MSFGLDYVTGPPLTAMKDAGVTFVCRYLSYVNALTRVKLLQPAEAKALGENGIAIVSNYEWYADRALEGAVSGVQDAQIAASQHSACGGPDDRPIYFSVDADVSGSQVLDYFKGVVSVIGLSRTGAYGSFRVLKELFDANAIAWGWQTYAWSGGAWEPRAHIQQYQNGVDMSGHSVDYDRAVKSDFGQWFSQAQEGDTSMIPTGWHDANNTLTAPNGVPVILGFRAHILNAASWDGGNLPQEAEYHTDQVLLHNAALGAGQRQCFRDGVLWYTTARGVVWEPFLGLELDAAYRQIATLQAQIPPVGQPDPSRPTANVAQAINDLEGLTNALPPMFTKILADLGKQ